jgi:putative ABC transport system permease protein
LSGTITWLPSVGQVIKPGQALFRIAAEPVTLMNGHTPAYRDLGPSDNDAQDILELNRNLVALLVGAIGIINIMVISVLERRTEIGIRRALGATRQHITIQFLTESAMLAAIGGVTGLLLGAGATQIYALTKHEPFVVPLYALITAPVAGFLIGVVAGIYPAAKAAQLSPTEALRT